MVDNPQDSSDTAKFFPDAVSATSAEQAQQLTPAQTPKRYTVGDIVNGYKLESDNQWHPVYQVGDVVNGHFLSIDGTWHPKENNMVLHVLLFILAAEAFTLLTPPILYILFH